MIFSEIDHIGLYSTTNDPANTAKKREVLMYEINFCVENGGTAHVNSKAIPVRKNTIICAKPGQTRFTTNILKCYYVHFETENPRLRDILTHLPDTITAPNEAEYMEIFKDLCKYFYKQSVDAKIMLESLLLKLIYRIKSDSADEPEFDGTESKQAEIVRSAIKYIKENLTEDLSLEAMAKRFSFSPVYFHNIFKACMRKTLREYVEERRINASIQLLLTTSKPLSDISYECGFSSQSYFCYAFKRYTGATPKNYVKEYTKNLQT